MSPFRLGRPDLVLLVTGGGNGMMEVCNCSGPMPGGLARRSGLVLSYRAAFPNTFVLDAGDAFWIAGDDVRNEFLLHGYRQIGYDAIVLGDQEWSVPHDRLRKLLVPGPMTYLSTTVALSAGPPAGSPEGTGEGDAMPLSRVVKRQMGGAKLAVLSDLRRRALLFFPDEQLRDMRFADPNEISRDAEQLRKDGYVVVVVVHGDDKALEETVQTTPADLYLRGHTMKPRKELYTVGGKLVAKIGGSEHVGAVAMKLSAEGRPEQVECRLEVVDTRWPMDERLIQTYQAYCHVAMRNALDAERRKGLDYVPSAQCGRCHTAQYRSWEKTQHARAYQTLVRNKRAGDPSCLMCHTSGFGAEKGFYTIEKTPGLAAVNCQDCHRHDDAGHPLVGGSNLPKPDEKVCTACHTPVTDPRFDYKAKLPKIACASTRPAAR